MTALQNEMERIGRIVAADQKLQVYIRGVLAYATEGVVTIPNIESFEWLGKNAHRMLHGLLDHECGHAEDSDFSAFERFKLEKPSDALRLLQNIVEDGYVERLRGKKYAGCRRNIRLMNEWFYQRKDDLGHAHVEHVASETNGLWQAFMMALGTVLTPYGHRDVEFYKGVNERVYQMLLACREEIKEACSLWHSKATDTNIEIAKRIYARFKEEAEKKPEPEEKEGDGGGDGEEKDGSDSDKKESEGGGGGTGEEDESEGKPEGKDKSAGEEDESGEETGGGDDEGDESGEAGAGDEAGGDDGKDAGEEAGEDDADGGGDKSNKSDDGDDTDGEKVEAKMPPEVAYMDLERWTEDTDCPLNASDQINVIIRSVFERSGEELPPYTVFSHEFDAFRDFASEDLSEATKQYDSEMEEASEASDSLVQCFEAALHASEMARPVGGNDEGDVDVTALPEYAVGSLPADQLYVQYAETDAGDVAVAILCDCSGSMSRKHKLCRLAAMAMSSALRQVQIAHEVSGFTTMTSESVNRNRWAKDKGQEYHAKFAEMRRALLEAQNRGTDVRRFARELYGHSSFSSVDRATLCVPFHVRFKSFESEDARGLVNISALEQNLDGEAVLWQAQRLAERGERRKVLFVLSDGLPAGSRDNEQGARYLKEVIDRVIESGIEVYGLGIQSEHVKGYYPVWWVCQEIADLTEVAMTGLIEVLTRNRTERERVYI
jgi:hypothetical protein